MTTFAEFSSRVHTLVERIKASLEHIKTEEATKHAFVLPMLQALGYDVFDPSEVVPEFIADLGIKKGEKVDYAIMKAGVPMMIIECKPASGILGDSQNSQLFRYFTVTPTRVAVLTNGLRYDFYTDLDQPNVMDPKPFLEIDMRNLGEGALEELWRMSKPAFDHAAITQTAFELRYTKAIKRVLDDDLSNPSIDFVKFLTGRIYEGRATQGVIEKFTPFIRAAVTRSVNERINARLRQAFVPEAAPSPSDQSITPAPTAVVATATAPADPAKDEILTTEDELMAFYAVKAILNGVVDVKRVRIRDAKSYCAVLLDDNNRKPICRFWFNGKAKQLGLFDADKNEQKVKMDDVDSIYAHSESLRSTVKRYESAVAAVVADIQQGAALPAGTE